MTALHTEHVLIAAAIESAGCSRVVEISVVSGFTVFNKMLSSTPSQNSSTYELGNLQVLVQHISSRDPEPTLKEGTEAMLVFSYAATGFKGIEESSELYPEIKEAFPKSLKLIVLVTVYDSCSIHTNCIHVLQTQDLTDALKTEQRLKLIDRAKQEGFSVALNIILYGSMYPQYDSRKMYMLTRGASLWPKTENPRHPQKAGDGNSTACNKSCVYGSCYERLKTQQNAPDAVCCCDAEHWGRTCTDTNEEWAQIAQLDHHKMSASSSNQTDDFWWYLSTPPYKMRYVLAAKLLAALGCKHVLEIGGFKTPISEFLDGTSVLTSTTVDPLVEPYQSDQIGSRTGQVLHLRTTIQEYSLRGDEDAYVYLGVAPEWSTLIRDFPAIQESLKVIILEGAKFGPIRSLISRLGLILRSKGFHQTLELTFDFSHMVEGDLRVQDAPDPAVSPDPDNNKRTVFVFTRGDQVFGACLHLDEHAQVLGGRGRACSNS